MKNKHILTGLILKGLIILTVCSSLIMSVSGNQQHSSSSQKYSFIQIVHAQTTVTTPAPTSSAVPKTFQEQCLEGEGTTKNTEEDKETQKILKNIITPIIWLEKTILGLNLPIVMVIGKLLSNEWVYLDGKIAEVLQTLWILIRNLVNIGFVVILIFVAFMAVLGIGGDKSTFAIKTVLPKMIIALLVVNFSFLLGKIILDVGNLATTASFSIVNEVGPSIFTQGDELKWSEKAFCYTTEKDTNRDGKTDKNDEQKKVCLGEIFYMGFGEAGKEKICSMYNDPDDARKIDKTRWYNKSSSMIYGFSEATVEKNSVSNMLFGSRNAMFVYSYNIFRVAEIMKLYDTNNDKVVLNDVTGIALNIVLSVIFSAILILLNVGMLIAFGIRMVMIWIMLIFSPLIALEIVFPDKLKKISAIKEGFLNSFIALAFMPAICGFILSLGFLMYHVIMSTNIMREAVVIPLGPLQIFLAGGILPGFGSIQQVVLAFVMMIIVWKAIFASLGANEYTKKGIEGIEKFGNEIGGVAGKGLTLIPIVPTGRGFVAPAALKSGMDRVNSNISTLQNKSYDQLGKQFRSSFFLEKPLSPQQDALLKKCEKMLDEGKQKISKGDILQLMSSGVDHALIQEKMPSLLRNSDIKDAGNWAKEYEAGNYEEFTGSKFKEAVGATENLKTYDEVKTSGSSESSGSGKVQGSINVENSKAKNKLILSESFTGAPNVTFKDKDKKIIDELYTYTKQNDKENIIKVKEAIMEDKSDDGDFKVIFGSDESNLESWLKSIHGNEEYKKLIDNLHSNKVAPATTPPAPTPPANPK